MNEELSHTILKNAISTLADQIAADSQSRSRGPLAVIGLRSRGVVIAKRLIELVKARGVVVSQQGVLDTTLYRDDLNQVGGQARVQATEINFNIDDYVVILVDDVIFTGRTTRAALDALTDIGRAKAVRLAVLVDRGSRELPIQPDYVGLKLDHAVSHVQVKLMETDGEDSIILRE
jgi:pyrimidine operon attenuation protein/uracil phosphoribosyltransferase